jgi:hypothetical protein
MAGSASSTSFQEQAAHFRLSPESIGGGFTVAHEQRQLGAGHLAEIKRSGRFGSRL